MVNYRSSSSRKSSTRGTQTIIPLNAEKEKIIEKEILGKIYQETRGDDWDENNGWYDFETLDNTWYGIKLNPNNGFLMELELFGNSLEGQFPIAICNLKYLEKLVLHSNELFGSMPDTIGNMTSLKVLDLSFNTLSGKLPGSLTKLVDLKEIDLRSNEFEGTIPKDIHKLTALTTLHLGENKFTGEIPASIGQLSNVTHLSLNTNTFSGNIPDLKDMINLTELSLHENQLSGEIPKCLCDLNLLSGLYLNGNKLSGKIPANIFEMKELTYLSLQENQLSGEIPKTFNAKSKLVEINLKENQLIGTIPDTMDQLPELTVLDVSDNRLSGTMDSERINKLRQKVEIKSGGNQSIVEVLIEFYDATNGDSWRDNTGWCSKLSLDEWVGVQTDEEKNVIELDLSSNNLKGKIPKSIGKLVHLTRLILDSNELSGEIPASICKLYNLTELHLYKNPQISGEIPKKIGNLYQLEELCLYSCRLHGEVPESVTSLKNLTRLDLSVNQLNGEIAWIGELKKLETLCLNDNKFTGEVPEGVGDLKQLTLLELQNNGLTGYIPGHIADLVLLETLDLQGNKFEGNYEDEITSLDFNSNLNPPAGYDFEYPGNNVLINNSGKYQQYWWGLNKFENAMPGSAYNNERIMTALMEAAKLGYFKTMRYLVNKKGGDILYPQKIMTTNSFVNNLSSSLSASATTASADGKNNAIKKKVIITKSSVFSQLSTLYPLEAIEMISTWTNGTSTDEECRLKITLNDGEYRVMGIEEFKDYTDELWKSNTRFTLFDWIWLLFAVIDKIILVFYSAIFFHVNEPKSVSIKPVEFRGQNPMLVKTSSRSNIVDSHKAAVIVKADDQADNSEVEGKDDNAAEEVEEEDEDKEVEEEDGDDASDVSKTRLSKVDNTNVVSTVDIFKGDDDADNVDEIEYLSKFPVTSYFLPFPYMASVGFLLICVKLSNQTKSVELFKEQNVKVAVQAAWESYGRRYHIFNCCLYIAYLFLVTYSNYLYRYSYNIPLTTSILFLTTLFALMEAVQILRSGLREYLIDYENWLEASAFITMYIGNILRLVHYEDTILSREVMAIASILVWINSLNLLRPFKLTGSLVRMVFAVVIDIIPFLIILGLVLFGFSQAFFLLTYNTNAIDFNNIQIAYLSSFSYMMGQTPYETDDSINAKMLVALIVVFITFSQILLLNLLIAFLNNIYSGIQMNADAEGCKEQCKIIVNQVSPFSDRKGPKWIHFLKKNSDIALDISKKNDKENTNLKIKKELLDKMEISNHTIELEKNTVQTQVELSLQLESRMKEMQSNVNKLEYKMDMILKAINNNSGNKMS